MNTNERYNQEQFRIYQQQLKNLFVDLEQAELECLTVAVNKGVNFAKKNTPVDTGFMRRSWHSPRGRKLSNGCQKALVNNADYALYVDQGHRQVNKSGETVGFVKGRYITNKTISYVNKELLKELKKKISEVDKKYD